MHQQASPETAVNVWNDQNDKQLAEGVDGRHQLIEVISLEEALTR